MEAKNKSVQHWVPPVPQDKDWIGACHNITKLEKLRDTTFSDLGVIDPQNKTACSVPDLIEQIQAFWAVIRDSQYLDNPQDPVSKLVSITGDELDPQLINFLSDGVQKHSKVLSHIPLICTVRNGGLYSIK